MKTPEEIKAEYASHLADLTFNSKPLINMLTILAKDNLSNANVIVEVIETHLSKVNTDVKLPILYLIDCIVKNVGGTYTSFFAKNIIQNFCNVFNVVDKRTQQEMVKLLQTWKYVFPQTNLDVIDHNINNLGSSWQLVTRVVTPTLSTPTLSTPAVGNINKEALLIQQRILIQKQKELLDLQTQQLELEIFQLQLKLRAKAGSSAIQERLPNHLACQPKNINPVSPALDAERPFQDPRPEPAQDQALQSFASPPKNQAKIVDDPTKEKASPPPSAKEDENIILANKGMGEDLRHLPAVVGEKRTSTDIPESGPAKKPKSLIMSGSEPGLGNASTTAFPKKALINNNDTLKTDNINDTIKTENPLLTPVGSALKTNDLFQKLMAYGSVKSETTEAKSTPAPVVTVRGKSSTVQTKIPPPEVNEEKHHGKPTVCDARKSGNPKKSDRVKSALSVSEKSFSGTPPAKSTIESLPSAKLKEVDGQ